MRKETIFLNAQNAVAVYKGVANLVGLAKNGKTLKYIFDTHNIDYMNDTVYFQSTMDFADEEGFAAADGAKQIVAEMINEMEDCIMSAFVIETSVLENYAAHDSDWDGETMRWNLQGRFSLHCRNW